MNRETRGKAPPNKRRLTDAYLRSLKPRSKTFMVWDDQQSRFGIQVTPAGTLTFKCTYTFGKRLRWMSLARYPSLSLKDAREIAQANGLKYVYTGNVNDVEGGSTYCPNCSEMVIERDWYQLGRWHLDAQGCCVNCGTWINGVFESKPGDWGRKRQVVKLN